MLSVSKRRRRRHSFIENASSSVVKGPKFEESQPMNVWECGGRARAGFEQPCNNMASDLHKMILLAMEDMSNGP